MSNFNSLNLNPLILSELEAKGYKTPTPVQLECIPILKEGRDLLGIAQTGTGKTASFSLPLIHTFSEKPKELNSKNCRALILTPTRELASQIERNILTYGKSVGVTSTVLIGGVDKEKQVEELSSGRDFVVATPGRLLDILRSEDIDFSQLEAFVLDEADMMLDMGFLDDVKTICHELPTEKQSIMFSATMPKTIEALANDILVRPEKVEITPESSTIEKIDQRVYFVDDMHKLFLLSMLLEDQSLEKIIIFCKAKYGVADVVEHLKNTSISVGEIHSNKTQHAREEALDAFSKGELRVLVATEIAARGIDVSGIDCVINFNMPEDATNYVHRIGRTARAGKSGVAISLCGQKDLALLRNVETLIKKKIKRVLEHPFHKDLVIPVKKKRSRRRRR
jgi:ATP-dependent RNA helicase RhlE